MKDIFIFLTDGFEEIEAVATVDITRRADLNIRTVSLTASQTVTGGHGIPVIADMMFDDVDFANAGMLVLPGGTVKINEHDGLKARILDHAAKGGRIAAICAAPMVLGSLGLLEGKRATCYPGFEKYLKGARLTTEPVEVDGNIITGRGPGLTPEFALAIVRELAGANKAKQVAAGLLLS